MLFVWQKGTTQPTAYKCKQLPSSGTGTPAAYLAKHVLRGEEEGLPIRELARIYPAPEFADV